MKNELSGKLQSKCHIEADISIDLSNFNMIEPFLSEL